MGVTTPALRGSAGSVGAVGAPAASRAGSKGASSAKRLIRTKRFAFKEVGQNAAWMLMGQALRHPVSGEINIAEDPLFKDFVLVDLFKRRNLPQGLAALNEDKYLFKPYPLPYRTWLYHEDYRKQLTLDKDENAMFKAALTRHCVDAPILAGRWSPVVALAPMTLGVALMRDMPLLIVCLLLALGMQWLSQFMNNIKWYRWIRLVSFVPRIGLYVGIIFRFIRILSTSGGLAILGSVWAFGIILGDLLAGDLRMLVSGALICHWEIVSVLPKRVFVCLRHGAMRYEERYGPRGVVPEAVVGFATWQKEHALIVDLFGILVELRPVTREDWEALVELCMESDDEVPILGLDVYSEEIPTMSIMSREASRINLSKKAFVT